MKISKIPTVGILKKRNPKPLKKWDMAKTKHLIISEWQKENSIQVQIRHRSKKQRAEKQPMVRNLTLGEIRESRLYEKASQDRTGEESSR